jgi:hypothetical protein
VSGTFSPLLFIEWLRRRAETESLAQIGASLGVSAPAVHKWLHGAIPSKTVLLLAKTLAGPTELRPGLPGDK